MENRYLDIIDYSYHIEAMIEEQQQMQDYINECIILSNPNRKQVFTEMVALNEAKASDRIGSFFTRLKSFFSKIWLKFLEKINKLTMDDKKYLEQYKDIIIGKKVTLAEVKMTDHLGKGSDRIKNVCNKITLFATPINFEATDGGIASIHRSAIKSAKDTDKENNNYNDYLKSQCIEVFKAAGISSIKVDTVDEISQVGPNLNNYFKGGEDLVSYNSGEIQDKMSVMFKAVYEYKEMVDGLNKIKEAYISAMDKSEKAYNDAYDKMANVIKAKDTAYTAATNDVSDIEKTEAYTKAYTKVTDTKGAYEKELDKAKADAKKENYVYSNVMGSYISEAEVSSSSSTSSDSSKPASSTVSPGTNKVDSAHSKTSSQQKGKEMTATASTVKSNTTNSVQTAGAAAAAAKQVQAVSGQRDVELETFRRISTNLIKAYSTARTTVFAGMLHGLEVMRKDYMDIMRAHVNTYLGQVNDTADNTNKTSV